MNLTGPHRDLTSTPSNSWHTDIQPGLVSKTSLTPCLSHGIMSPSQFRCQIVAVQTLKILKVQSARLMNIHKNIFISILMSEKLLFSFHYLRMSDWYLQREQVPNWEVPHVASPCDLFILFQQRVTQWNGGLQSFIQHQTEDQNGQTKHCL